MDLAEEFFKLFQGYSKAHGRTDLTEERTEKNKLVTKSWTAKGTGLTVELWAWHLSEDCKGGIGCIPLTDDDGLWWMCVDIDVYRGLDHAQIEQTAKRLKLPFIVCRSKSGGAHLKMFFKEQIAAKKAIAKLEEFRAALGYAKSECFPKQDHRSDPHADFGNWLNMPYHQGKRTMRYAIRDGKALSPEEFIAYAKEMAITEKELMALKMGSETDFSADGPPCLQSLAKTGVEEGGRNNVMFSAAVYLKKKFPDSWKTELAKANSSILNTPLPAGELATVEKSLEKNKDYNYKCKDTPICNFCDLKKCQKRPYGVSDGKGSVGVNIISITKVLYNPPWYVVELDKGRVTMESGELFLNQRAFRAKCLDKLSQVPYPVKDAEWCGIVNELMATAQEITVDEEASLDGQLSNHIVEYVNTNTIRAQVLEEVVAGKVYTDNDTGMVYFKWEHLLAYLKHKKVLFDSRMLHDTLTKRFSCRKGQKPAKSGKSSFRFMFMPMVRVDEPEEFPVPQLVKKEVF